MNPQRLHLPLQWPVESLCWHGDALIDWAGGGVVLGLDGSVSDSRRRWGYRFDAAVQSPSGRYAVVYKRLGTKALLLDRGEIVRELNRSYYFADTYEYPIALLETPDGRTLIARCPEACNRIEIEDAESGTRLTAAPDREPADCFHSRLAASPRGGRLMSAGWIWHPVDFVSTWSMAEALNDGRILDELGAPEGTATGPMSNAVFIDEDHILVSSNADDEPFDRQDLAPFHPGSVGVFNLKTSVFESIALAEETIGTMLWIGDGLVVGFHQCPRVFDIATGRIVHRWPDIVTGAQTSSIIDYLDALPALACDPVNRRFAVASGNGVEVVSY